MPRLLPLTLLIILTACNSSASKSPSGSDEPSREVSTSPSPAVAPTSSADRDWTEVAAFATPEGIETVHDVDATPFGLLAVGVSYGTTAMPVFGGVPQVGRIWQSEDGRDWRDVTPEGTFAGASLYSVVALADSALAFGTVDVADEAGMPVPEPRSWMTQDGSTWQLAELVVDGEPVRNVVEGDQGYLVLTRNAPGGTDIWYASQLWDVQRVQSITFDGAWGSIAAGPEGFVAVRITPHADGATSAILASGDGIEWFDSASAPRDGQFVAPLGPDWVAVGPGPFQDKWESTTTPSWVSANGLDWTEAGDLPLEAVGPTESRCREFVSRLASAGNVVIASTTLSYPCGEGQVQRFGRSSVTTDATTWDVLPFTAEIDLADQTRGTTVNAALSVGDRLLLVGERDLQAAFWLFD